MLTQTLIMTNRTQTAMLSSHNTKGAILAKQNKEVNYSHYALTFNHRHSLVCLVMVQMKWQMFNTVEPFFVVPAGDE